MAVVLSVSNVNRINRLTGLFAGMLIMTYISLETPISGMSINPARRFASAFWAQIWTARRNPEPKGGAKTGDDL